MAARVLMGRIGRPHGVRGLVHLVSFTDPPEAIFAYPVLTDEAGRRVELSRSPAHGSLLARIAGAADRDAASRLTNQPLYADRTLLAEPGAGEFYHADLLGLAAVDAAGRRLGRVAAVHDHGAGAFLEIAGDGTPLLLPFTSTCVPVVDIAGGRLVASPPEEIVVPASAEGDAA